MLAEMQNNGAPLFDLDHLIRYTGTDENLQVELLGLMHNQSENCVALMQAAKDRSSWRIATHTLKGASRGVGAFALADVCEAAEEIPQESWPGATLAVVQKIKETEAAIFEITGFSV